MENKLFTSQNANKWMTDLSSEKPSQEWLICANQRNLTIKRIQSEFDSNMASLTGFVSLSLLKSEKEDNLKAKWTEILLFPDLWKIYLCHTDIYNGVQ